MTFTRAGFDAKRQRMWYVDQNLDLWLLDPGTLRWAPKQVTTGTKPDKFGIFQRHEDADVIVGVGRRGRQRRRGRGQYLSPEDLPARSDHVRLDATDVRAPTTTDQPPELLAAVAPVPPAWSNAQNQMVYDPIGKRILLHTGSNYNRQTWALTLGTTGPPPVSSTR